jgi:hypothetical protein
MPSKTRTAIAAVPNIDADKPPIFLNVDTMEREGGSKGPYPIFVGGRRFILKDAEEMDWQDLVRAQTDPISFFRKAMDAKDAAAFLSQKIAFWRFNGLIAKYLAHYGIGTSGEA